MLYIVYIYVIYIVYIYMLYIVYIYICIYIIYIYIIIMDKQCFIELVLVFFLAHMSTSHFNYITHR